MPHKGGTRQDGTPVEDWHLRLPVNLSAALRLYCARCHVYKSTLVEHILTLFVRSVIDPADPAFSAAVMGCEFPKVPVPPPTAVPDYLRMLGVDESDPDMAHVFAERV